MPKQEARDKLMRELQELSSTIEELQPAARTQEAENSRAMQKVCRLPPFPHSQAQDRSKSHSPARGGKNIPATTPLKAN